MLTARKKSFCVLSEANGGSSGSAGVVVEELVMAESCDRQKRGQKMRIFLNVSVPQRYPHGTVTIEPNVSRR